ncbi:MAG: class I SAM-dependent methyltransferase [Alphaproteobacteria bacterium]|nr:class I SAM-dependent methyltransferase [Alphaproteobacteria bacterium]
MAEIRIAFRQGGNSGQFTREGWADPEGHGSWTEGPNSHLRFSGLFAGVPYAVAIDLGPYLAPPMLAAQALTVSVNGHLCFEDRLNGPCQIRFTIPAGAIPPGGQAEMVLTCSDAVAPMTLGTGADMRRLGFSVWQVTLEDQPAVAAAPLAVRPAEPVFAPVPLGIVPQALPAVAPPPPAAPAPGPIEFRAAGTCPLCGQATEFIARRATPLPEQWYPNWFRDGLRCAKCDSLPRERALFTVVERLYPNWRDLAIHESSPGDRGASLRFRQECRGYVETQYDPELGFGKTDAAGRYRSENLEAQTFPGQSFDLVITQDVFEHLFEPDKAIREIARTLRPGGAYIMTVPIANEARPSSRRAARTSQGVKMLAEAQYHGNPVSAQGSLVTIDWGFDIVDYLAAHSGLSVSMFYFDDISRGMRAICMEVIVCRKLGMPPSL